MWDPVFSLLIGLLMLDVLTGVYLIIHEGAHAILMRHYKMAFTLIVGLPTIIKTTFGGVRIHLGFPLVFCVIKLNLDEFSTHPWQQRLRVILIGPVAGICVGAVILLILLSEGTNPLPLCVMNWNCGFSLWEIPEFLWTLYQYDGLQSLIACLGIMLLGGGVLNLTFPLPPSDASKIILVLLEGWWDIKIPEEVVIMLTLLGWIIFALTACVMIVYFYLT